LRELFIIIAVSSVPLGLVVTWEPTKMAVALAITPLIVAGSTGYFIGGGKGVFVGVVAGVASVFLALLSLAVWMYFTGATINDLLPHELTPVNKRSTIYFRTY